MNLPSSTQNRSPKRPTAVHWKAIPEENQTGRSLELFHSKDGASQVSLVVKKKPACQCRRHERSGFNPWVGKTPGGKRGNPVQETWKKWVQSLGWEDSWRKAWQPTPVFSLENPLDRGDRWATVQGVTKSQTQLSRDIHTQGLLRQSKCGLEKNFRTQGTSERNEFIKNKEQR